jgi:Secretion system C-terminal sorting domain
MKKLLLLFSILFFLKTSNAQIVFSPLSAEWHYLYYSFGNVKINEEIKYVRDSILSSETVKVLQHKKFFKNQNFWGNKLTLIKQSGDTVFFRSVITEDSWQILYNYAATPGQSWENQIKLINPFYATTVVTTHTTTVDSVKTITVNSTNLRTLFATKTSTYTYGVGNAAILNFQITERFGCDEFMFNFYNSKYVSDADFFEKFLCYKDDTFTEVQFTETDCYYSNPSSLGEINPNSMIQFYPNPSGELLKIEIEDADINTYQLKIINVLGNVEDNINELLTQNNIKVLSTSQLKAGIYFLQVFKGNKLIANKKIVKD